ncbi:Heterokaryon incompatibility protein (HET) domain containing protein [Naviculisporaceae sp. PSN 640]
MIIPYIYERLPSAGQIRLLKLQPSARESAPINFTLTTANLHDNPSYEAISYCWGDSSNPQAVYCDHQVLFVTQSLYSALRRFRLPDKVRTLWADAVCINQQDDIEKAQQVNLMTRIYSQPKAVLIWLGDDSTGLDGLDACLKGALEVLPPDTEDRELLNRTVLTMHKEAAELRKQGKPNFNDHDWTPMNHLLCRPWFDRRWIIQEVAMAPDHVPRKVICGQDIEFDWSDLASICYRIGSYGMLASIAGFSAVNPIAPSMPSFLLLGGRPVKTLALTFFTNLIKKYRSSPTTTLVDAVTATALFQCTDPRDHLYSLLNITPNNSDLSADYNISVEEVCTRFAVATLKVDKNLRLLSLAPHTFLELEIVGNKMNRLDLPSWVPDLTSQGIVNPLVSYTIREQLFHAGQAAEVDDEVVIQISADRKLLRLRGRIVDKIAAVSRTTNVDVPYSMQEPTWTRRVLAKTRDWLKECREVAAPTGHLKEKLEKDEKFKNEFALAVVHGVTVMRDPMPEEVLPMVHTYMAYVSDVFEDGFEMTEELSEMLLTYGPFIEGSMTTVGEARRFCRTEAGRLGQVRKEARVGDSVCVVFGAEVPYIIRRKEDKGAEEEEVLYELVGDCYIHGIMQGETLKDERYETVDIVLA